MNRVYEDHLIAFDLNDVAYIEKRGYGGYRVWLLDVEDALVFGPERGAAVLVAWKAWCTGDEEAA